MENQYSRKPNKKSAKQAQQRNSKKQNRPQKSEKAKKGGRQGKLPISGFSTLSQVAGVPLRRTYHSQLDVPSPKYVSEPYPICPYCGEKIDLIADSFFVNGEYIHFDCMLSSIKEKEILAEGQSISYLGSGAFGVCQKNEDGKYTIVKRIEVESKDDSLKMKNYIEGLKE